MSLRRMLKNWPYKLLALGAAIVLTSYVHGERNPWTSVSVEAALQRLHLQDGYVSRLSREKVPITLEGPKTEVDAVVGVIKSGEVKAWVDLAKLRAGVHTVPVQKLSIPKDLAPNVNSQPVISRVSVTIEPISSRTMPVQVRVKSPPPIGYAAGQPTVTPGMATVSGGSSLVESVARLEVVVDPTPLRPSVDEYVAIKALDARGDEVRGVDIAPDDAHVVLKLVEAPASKAVYIQPNVVGQPQYPYQVTKITVTPSSVTVKGKPEMLAGTSVISTDEVDVSTATSDIVRYVGLHVPPGVGIEGSDRVKITVRIVAGQSQ